MRLERYTSRIAHRFALLVGLRGSLAGDQTARILHVLVVTLVVWLAAGWIATIPFAPVSFPRIFNPAVQELSYAIALLLLRLGHFRRASLAYLAGTWIWATLICFSYGGIHSPGALLYVSLPASAAWLLGYKVGIRTAGWCLFGALVFTVLEMAHVSLPLQAKATVLGIWTILVQAVLVNAIPVGQIIGSLRETLKNRNDVEEELRQSEERFRLAVQATNDAVWDIDLMTGTVSWNETYATLYGRPTETSKSWQWWIDSIHPEDRERTSEGLRSAISGSESTWTCEYRFQRVDGTWAYIYDRAYIARYVSGKAWRVIGAMQDLTERKQAEDKLRESEERFRRVFEEGPLGLALVGKDYHFVKVNAALCELVGYPEASLLQMTFADITHPDDLQADVVLAELLFRSDIPFYAMQKRYVKNNGEIIWINLTASMLHDKDGAPIYGLAMIEDITEVKRAQEIENRLRSDLEHSRDEIRALAAGLMMAQEDERRRISRELHDQICQQLASLAMDIGGLSASPRPPKNLHAQLRAIQSRVVKASEETRHIAYEMHPSMLDDLGLVASLGELNRQFTQRYPDIELDFKEGAMSASLPREVASCLYHVAQEGLRNLAKHSNAKHVSVALGLEKGAVVLTIKDDGAGFDLEALRGSGGLGLIGMEERARLVKGNLTIATKPGHGTQIVVKVRLPGSNL